MKDRWVIAMVLAGTAWTSAGCLRLDPALRAEIQAAAEAETPPVTDDRAVRVVGAAAAAGEIPAQKAWPLPERAGLADYVREALRRNPAIRAAVRNVERLGYRVPQVTSLEDPMVMLVPPTDDMIETAAGMMDGSVGVTQRLPFPGKRRRRGRVAEQEVRIALDRLADVRIRTAAEVRRTYYDYYLADAATRITRTSAELLRRARDVAQARYGTGTATQQDVLRADVELYGLASELVALEQQRGVAGARLNTLVARQVDAPLPDPAALELETVAWRLPEASARAFARNPRLAALRAQVRRDLEAVHLARLEYLPDLTVGYSYTAIAAPALSPVATGDDAWDLSLGFNLPVWWQRRRAQVLEGNAQILRSVAEYEDARDAVVLAVQDALLRIDRAHRQAVIARDLIVPRAWQAVEAALPGYETGALDFVSVIEGWRTWLDRSLAYHRTLAQLERALADLDEAIGVGLPEGLEEVSS